MKRLVVLFLSLYALLVSAEAVPLDPLVERPDLWEVEQETFVDELSSLGFRWVSSAQDTAEVSSANATLFGVRVHQAIARFKDGTHGIARRVDDHEWSERD